MRLEAISGQLILLTKKIITVDLYQKNNVRTFQMILKIIISYRLIE